MPQIAKIPVVAGVVLVRDTKVLLVQEAKPAVYGQWNLPGGRVDEGETLEQAAIREAREEVGFAVEIIHHLLLINHDMTQSVLHAYLAKITGSSLQFPADEIFDARWFTLPEIIGIRSKLRNEEYVLGAIEAAEVVS